MFTEHFLQDALQSLLRRKSSKQKILQSGGEQALSHSYQDIRRIDFALKRILHGQYGLCIQCGVPIDEERLKIIPETPLCTDCAKGNGSH